MRNVSILFGAVIALSAACAPAAPKVGSTSENETVAPHTIAPPIAFPTTLCEPPGCTFLLCGSTGNACCPGNECSGGVCMDGVCKACGSPGNACCGGNVCIGGECASGICQSCGTQGEACCENAKQKCGSGLACVDGSCQADCGTEGKTCCNGTECKGQYETCSGGMCAECGMPGGTCCPDGSCQGDEECFDNGNTQMCTPPCGDTGEPCCEGLYCNSGECLGGGCSECGDIDEPCCTGDVCFSGSCNLSEMCE